MRVPICDLQKKRQYRPPADFFSAFNILRPPLNAHSHAAAHANLHRQVFFRRSRLFLREAAFSSGGEGCEWGAKQPTVGASGDKAENEFSGFIPLIVPRKGFSPRIPASRLFYLLHPTKSPQNPPKIHQKSKIQINPSHKPIPPYIYNVYPPPPKKSKKHLPISKKSTNFALAKSQTAHLQPSQSRANAHQKPNCKNFFKKSVKNLHSPNKGCNFASLSAREEIISRERFF